MKTSVRILFVLCLAASPAAAKIWRVDNNPGGFGDFTTIQEAVDSVDVQPGDTLHIAGSATYYNGGHVYKQLTLVGPGYFLAENEYRLPSLHSAKSGGGSNVRLEIKPLKDDQQNILSDPSGTTVMGMDITNLLISEVDTVLIKRNRITGEFGTWEAVNCVFSGNYFGGGPDRVSVNGAGNIFINNVVYRWGVAFPGSVSQVQHNIFDMGETEYTYFTFESAYFANNIFILSTPETVTLCDLLYMEGSLAEGNVVTFDCPEIPAGANDVLADSSGVFVGGESPDAQYVLAESSPASGAGVGGVDAGIFGSDEPYVISGFSEGPVITELRVPTFATEESGLEITVKAKAND
jgi:hypothetical protein